MYPIRIVSYLIAVILLGGCFDNKKEDLLRSTSKGAWLTYWDFENGVNAIEAAPSVFNDVLLFVAHLDTEGRVVFHKSVNAMRTREFVGLVNSRGLQTWLTVVNDVLDEQGRVILKDSDTVARMLQSPETRLAHIRQLVAMANENAYLGIDIDYENLSVNLRDLYSQFTRELASEAHAVNLKLSITVQPKQQEKNSMGAGAADWKAICEATDRLQIMLYNEHSGRTEPGPMATPDWISGVLDYAVSQCSSKKIVPVLKVSGMKWSNGDAEGIQYIDAMSLLEQHKAELLIDPRGNTPYFSFSENEQLNTVYFENADSIMRKVETILKYRLSAMVFWSLGRHDTALALKLSGVPESSP